MSAREEFMEWLERFYPTTAGAVDLPGHIDAMLNEHAHELAEKLREHKTELTESIAGLFAIDDAADLIDPEVGDGRR